MDFTKMNGLGNDYIFIDEIKNRYEFSPDRIKYLCDRNFGIGGDGVVLVGESTEADFSMRIFNADGSEAEMCGNALRCLVKFVHSNGLTTKTNLTISTKAGKRKVLLRKDGTAEANMGVVSIEKTACVFGENGYIVDAGNPHFVVVRQNALKKTFDRLAKKISENKTVFPKGINVEVCTFDRAKNEGFMRVWERGTGETLACGTGASAVFEVGRQLGYLTNNATIVLPGGKLVFKRNEQGEIIAIGNAEINYIGKTYE